MSHEQGHCTPVKAKIKRFTQETRAILERLLKQKRTKTEIASIIQISVRSINREIKANSYRNENELGKVTYEYRADWRESVEDAFRSMRISPYHLAVWLAKLHSKGYAVPDVSSSTLYYAIHHGIISTNINDIPLRGKMRRALQAASLPLLSA